MTEIKQTKQFYPKTILDWRKWLEKNHSKENQIAVIRYKKHTKKNSPNNLELMHEAICFGWIDTTVKGIDADKYMINFRKRTQNAKWSDNTLSYGKKLIKEGRMAGSGLVAYKHGLSRPTHDHGIPKNPNVPEDLKKILKEKKLEEQFNKLAPSSRRTYLRWLFRAKLKETRIKRINIIIRNILENKKLDLK